MLDKRRNRESLVAESDDLVMVYDVQSGNVPCWYVKQDPHARASRALNRVVEEHLDNVKQWTPADPLIYASQLHTLRDNLRIVTAAMRDILT